MVSVSDDLDYAALLDLHDAAGDLVGELGLQHYQQDG